MEYTHLIQEIKMSVSKALIVIALICFVFAAFGFNPSGFNLIALGLTFATAAKL